MLLLMDHKRGINFLIRTVSTNSFILLKLACLQIFFSLQTAVTEDSDSDVEDLCTLIEKSHCHLLQVENCVVKSGCLLGDDCVCIYFARFLHLIIRFVRFMRKCVLSSFRKIKASLCNFLKFPLRICGKISKFGLSITNRLKFF